MAVFPDAREGFLVGIGGGAGLRKTCGWDCDEGR